MKPKICITRLLQRLKMCVTCLVTLSLVVILSLVFYLHSYGLPSSLCNFIEKQAAAHGVYLEIKAIKYQLNKGLVAEGLTYYQTAEKNQALVSLSNAFLEMDKTKLLRSKIEIDRAGVSSANLSLPLFADQKNAPLLNVSNINGKFSLSNRKQLEIAEPLHANIEGIDVQIKGRMWYKPDPTVKKPPLTTEEKQKYIAQFNQAKIVLKLLKWASNKPPKLHLNIRGNVADPNDLEIDFQLESESIAYKNAEIKQIKITGSYHRKLITFKSIAFKDKLGHFQAYADLSLTNFKGNFFVESSIDFKHTLDEFFDSKFAKEVVLSGKNKINAEGKYTIPHKDKKGKKQPAYLHLLGDVELEKVHYLNEEYDSLTAKFSWKKDSLFLSNLLVRHPSGYFSGNLLMSPKDIKFSSAIALPPRLFMPFAKGRSYEKTLKQLQLNKESRVNISANGIVNRKDLTDWKASGNLYLYGLAYRNSKIDEASMNFDLSLKESTFTSIEAYFDQSNWHKNKTKENDGFTKVAKVQVNKDPEGNNQISVTDAEGRIWLSPIVTMFNKKAGKAIGNMFFETPVHFEQSNFNFSFKKPNLLQSEGQVNLKNVSLSGMLLKRAKAKLGFEKGLIKVKDFEALIDYSNYFREKQQQRKTKGILRIPEVLILTDPKNQFKTIIMQGIKGKLWPAAITAMFAPKTAKTIDKTIPITAPVESINSTIYIKQMSPKKWITTFDLDFGKFAYNNIPFLSAKSKITLLDGMTVFLDTQIKFDYSKAEEYKQFGGSKQSITNIKRIILKNKHVELFQITGKFWPLQLAKMFSKDASKAIRKLDFTSQIKANNINMRVRFNKQWKIAANFNLGAFSYNKIPLNFAQMQMIISETEVLFNQISAQLNNTNYSMQKKHGGKKTSNLYANEVRIDLLEDLIYIDQLKGAFWPGFALRLFSPKVAEAIEEFRFLTPPNTNTTGIYDSSKKGKRTLLTTYFKTNGPTKYNFLDKDLTLNSVSGKIETTSDLVQVSKLNADLLGSTKKNINEIPLNGWLKYYYSSPSPHFHGYVAWNELSLKQLGKVYEIEKMKDGELSGILEFTINQEKGVKSMQGKGTVDIQKANLANIPLVGPISMILGQIGKTVKNERLGYARINKAFANFIIKDGIIYTKNLIASSSSLELQGKGKINLDKEQVNMLITLNKLSKLLSPVEIVRAVLNEIPIINGTVRYKVYGSFDKIKILPAPNK